MKTWTLSTCLARTATDLQKAIRMEAADNDGFARCCTCGHYHQWQTMDAGHYVGGRSATVVLEESGIHPQCKECNLYKHGNQEAYQRWMLTHYGQAEIDRLLALRSTLRQWTREELLELRIAYKDRIAVQKTRLEGAE